MKKLVPILPIAVMAFAIVTFLLAVDFSLETFENGGLKKHVTKNSNSSLVACTMDAKLCPDGTAVGRSGPKCEFTLCPGESTIDSFTACEAAGYPVMESYPRQCRANNTTFTETVANTNTSATTTGIDGYPENVAQQYVTDQQFYSEFQPGPWDIYKPSGTVPFTLNDYHSAVTPYGVMFWKKGKTRTTTFGAFGDTKLPYENGVAPDFRWFDFKSLTYVSLPETTGWIIGDERFERVFAVHPSISQARIVIEVGAYDIDSTEFEPGLIVSQPTKTRGLTYNPITNSWVNEDPLGVYLSVLNGNTTQWIGFLWDSQANIAVAVPGGEGCGPAPYISFINTQERTKVQVPSGTQSEGWGGDGFVSEMCNPHNGRSPNGQWLMLYGKAPDGRMAFQLYRTNEFGVIAKSAFLDAFTEISDYPKQWDTGQNFPIITMSSGKTIDFNR